MKKSIDRIERAPTQRGNGQVDAKRVLISTSDFGAISPFLRFSEDWFRAPGGFETHPHRGMQTVTLVLDGALHHRDHTGADGVLRQGDVQWMTAGRGVLHSEMPYGDEPAHTLQLWLNLPAAMKGLPARYVDQPGRDVPVRKLPGVEILVFAGQSGDIDQPHGSDWPLMLLDIRIEAGAGFAADIPSDWRGFLYVLEGTAQAGATAAAIEAPEMAWFEPSGPDGRDRLAIKAVSGFRALLLAGPPIDEPVVAYGPFVMNTPAEIQQAFSDYQNGRLVMS
ncbi:pirin family protein [Roseiarcaceae bacterium H3SJ34-1]|uniref:pirin family protein n=1 Tax=Terripilifer ovatus TaxID=3032367 RepID=UPI003AB9641A|nr:pirin family protein [Roseiarcaceae bacterium H3SJ34-1]